MTPFKNVTMTSTQDTTFTQRPFDHDMNTNNNNDAQRPPVLEMTITNNNNDFQAQQSKTQWVKTKDSIANWANANSYNIVFGVSVFVAFATSPAVTGAGVIVGALVEYKLGPQRDKVFTMAEKVVDALTGYKDLAISKVPLNVRTAAMKVVNQIMTTINQENGTVEDQETEAKPLEKRSISISNQSFAIVGGLGAILSWRNPSMTLKAMPFFAGFALGSTIQAWNHKVQAESKKPTTV